MQKKNIADAVQSLALQIKNFVKQYQKEQTKFEYIANYTAFRYQQIIGSLHKLVSKFYIDNNMPAVKKLQLTIAQLTQTEHVKLHLKPNNYSIRSCIVAPNRQLLESSSFIYGQQSMDDKINFKRCVQPIINQKALEPS